MVLSLSSPPSYLRIGFFYITLVVTGLKMNNKSDLYIYDIHYYLILGIWKCLFWCIPSNDLWQYEWSIKLLLPFVLAFKQYITLQYVVYDKWPIVYMRIWPAWQSSRCQPFWCSAATIGGHNERQWVVSGIFVQLFLWQTFILSKLFFWHMHVWTKKNRLPTTIISKQLIL